MEHAGEKNESGVTGPDTYVPGVPNIMADGGMMAGRISSGKFGNEKLSTYTNSPINTQAAGRTDQGNKTLSIQAMYKLRFGNNAPKATLPTQ